MLDMQGLFEMFRKTDINFSLWGEEKGAPTLTHLLDEINRGECNLTSQGGQIIRNIAIVNTAIFFFEGRQLFLQSSQQNLYSFSNINIASDASTSIRVNSGVLPCEATQKFLNTDPFNLNLTPEQLISRHRTYQFIPSVEYPGIRDRIIVHRFECYLNPKQYRPDGHLHITSQSVSQYHWVPMPSQPV
jgi:hypothetical protein